MIMLKVLAIITVYNEIDIIEYIIDSLLKQGIDVHIIDNWSTDGSYETVKMLSNKDKRVLAERSPPDKPTKTYDWTNLLHRVEEISSTSNYDWIIHHDADEVRESAWPKLNLIGGIKRVDLEGFNAIDFAVLDFRPTKNGFNIKHNPEKYFKYFEMGSQPGNFLQVKAWKNMRQNIDLVSSAGHDTKFKNRRVYPLKFINKHYSYRSLKQMSIKIKQRKQRMNSQELSKGWHQHLTITPRLWDKRTLFKFDTHTFNYSQFRHLDIGETMFNKNSEIKMYIQHMQYLTSSLKSIQGSKFYMVWQRYLNFRKLLLNIFN